MLLLHIWCIYSTLMSTQSFPTRQSELIRQARGPRSQAEFAKLLGVDRSCLSRYEREQLGAPTSVINHCLGAITAQSIPHVAEVDPVRRALRLTIDATRELEIATSLTARGG